MQDLLTLYKLIVLYMLNRVDFPLTKAQIEDFVLMREYTNYMTLQKVIGELIEASMIKAETIRNRTYLVLTADGSNTLSFFRKQIGEGIRNEIDAYLKQNELELRNEVSVISDYFKSTSGEYHAHLAAKDKEIQLVDITLSVPDEETAANICDNWQRCNQEVYQYLVKTLF